MRGARALAETRANVNDELGRATVLIGELRARLQTAERRLRDLAGAEEPPTPAEVEAIADVCRGART